MARALSTIRRATLLSFVLAAFVPASLPAGTRAHTPPRAAAELSLRPPAGMRSRSLRFAWEGALVRGMKLRESQYIRYVPEYAQAQRFHGTWELVQLLERAARRVAFRLPGAALSIGELSAERGGRISGHHSHQSGRDADIGFYMTTKDGRPYAASAFAEFDERGRGLAPNGGLYFDTARNWELVSKLVSDADARVQYIFVGRALRQRLLAEAARRKAPADVVARAAAVLVEPARGHPHRNHFHLRIYCAPADRPHCKDVGPFWAWYPGVPPEGTYAGVRARTPQASSPFSSPFGSAGARAALD